MQPWVALCLGDAGRHARAAVGSIGLPLNASVEVELVAQVDRALRISATGSPGKVEAELSALIDRHRPDEVILTGQIHDHAARLRSFEIAAEAMLAIGAKSGAAAT